MWLLVSSSDSITSQQPLRHLISALVGAGAGAVDRSFAAIGAGVSLSSVNVNVSYRMDRGWVADVVMLQYIVAL